MPASKAQQKAVNKYMKANYDRVNLTLPKGQKDTVQSHAAARGESVNGFIGRAIGETMERDSGGNPTDAAETAQGAGVVSLDPDTLERAQRAAEETGEPVPVLIWQAVCLRAGLEPGNVARAVAEAERTGETVSQFINRAVAEAVNPTDAAESPTEAARPGVVSLPPDVLERTEKAAESIGETVSGLVVRSVRAIVGQIERKQASGQTEEPGPVTLNYETEETARAAAEQTGETVEAFVSRAVDTQAAQDGRILATGENPVRRYQAEKDLAEMRRKRTEGA